MPSEWGFLVAHSLRTAEKSGPVREAYNARRRAGTAALTKLGYASYREALEDLAKKADHERRWSAPLAELERDAFLHVTGEALRVTAAVTAMEASDAAAFGRLLLESHASLRDRLKVSCAELDCLVDAAMESGALGARLTGAGFGGCAVVFAARSALPGVRAGLMARFYAKKAGGSACPTDCSTIIDAEPGPGALYLENS
jgi:galactokinase